ncbi:hypothetical protein PR048_024304 [Dryococelus australis]|uniref:Uncharacterized protein n=1 Tax=Dryococelus australis TaxID=614101 RepID=A0ABQ9GN82_9NEOP|nr:hypothetical protein PR048_024304 [Dryococelus australis]
MYRKKGRRSSLYCRSHLKTFACIVENRVIPTCNSGLGSNCSELHCEILPSESPGDRRSVAKKSLQSESIRPANVDHDKNSSCVGRCWLRIIPRTVHEIHRRGTLNYFNVHPPKNTHTLSNGQMMEESPCRQYDCPVDFPSRSGEWRDESGSAGIKGRGETGDLRENPLISGIVRHERRSGFGLQDTARARVTWGGRRLVIGRQMPGPQTALTGPTPNPQPLPHSAKYTLLPSFPGYTGLLHATKKAFGRASLVFHPPMVRDELLKRWDLARQEANKAERSTTRSRVLSRARNDERRARNDERRARNDERRARNDERRARNDERRARNDERRARNDERRARNDERRARNDERRARNDERRTKSEERRTESEERRTKSEERRTKSEERRTKSEERRTKSDDSLAGRRRSRAPLPKIRSITSSDANARPTLRAKKRKVPPKGGNTVAIHALLNVKRIRLPLKELNKSMDLGTSFLPSQINFHEAVPVTITAYIQCEQLQQPQLSCSQPQRQRQANVMSLWSPPCDLVVDRTETHWYHYVLGHLSPHTLETPHIPQTANNPLRALASSLIYSGPAPELAVIPSRSRPISIKLTSPPDLTRLSENLESDNNHISSPCSSSSTLASWCSVASGGWSNPAAFWREEEDGARSSEVVIDAGAAVWGGWCAQDTRQVALTPTRIARSFSEGSYLQTGVVLSDTTTRGTFAPNSTVPWESEARSKNFYQRPSVIRLLASHVGEPDSIPGRVAPGFSRVEIVADDDTGLRVFSGISRFSHSWIPALLHTHITSPSSALKTSTRQARRPAREILPIAGEISSSSTHGRSSHSGATPETEAREGVDVLIPPPRQQRCGASDPALTLI